MPGPLELYRTTIGKKVVMAISGVVWVGYLVAHMLGNLQIFAGPAAINAYSDFLHGTPSLLWTARLVLVAALVAHVTASVQLTRANLAARPRSYGRRHDVVTSYAARTMVWSGPLVLLFLVYHVCHLTLLVTPDYPLDARNVYNNLVYGFRIPWLSGLYIVSMLALSFHLYHGAWSFFQSLGVAHPRYDHHRRVFASAITVIIVTGFLVVPIAVLVGLVEPDVGSVATAQREALD